MGQLRQGVRLVHELAQGGRSEELLDGRGDRADIDERLGGDDIQVLDGHSLPDDPLHASKADAELVLKQLAHAAQAAVAQVVDVIGGAYAEGQAVEVVNGSHHVVHDDVLGDEVVHPLPDEVLKVLLRHALAVSLLQQLPQHSEAHLLRDARLFGIEVHEPLHVHHVVGEYLDQVHAGVQVLHLDDRFVDAQGVQHLGPLPGEHLADLGHDLAGGGVGHGGGQLLAGQPIPQGQLLVELVASHCGQVVPAGIEEQGVHQALGGVHRGRLAGTELAVDLQHGIFIALAGVFLQGGQDPGVLAEHVQDLRVGLGPHRPNQAGHRQLAVLVDAHVEHVGQVCLILQPGAPVRDDGGGVGDVVRLVRVPGVVYTGGTHQLGHDDPLGAVDDEGTRIGHDGEVPHEDLLLLDLLGLLVAQAHLHLDRGGVGGVLGLALLNGVLGGIVHGEADEGQLQIAGVVRDGLYVVEHLLQPGFKKPPVGFLLDLQQVGHLQNFLAAGEAFAQGLAVVDVLDSVVDRCCHCRFTLHS